MTAVGKWTLGFLSALAVIGGGMMTVMVILYFGPTGYVPELNEYGGWGILAGMAALAIYVVGAIRANVVARIVAGVGLGVLGLMVSVMVASLISLAGDRGGERGTLEDGSLGFIWLLAGAFFLWSIATCRWPVSPQPAHPTS